MAKKLKSKKMKIEANFIDYYQLFRLNRKMSCEELAGALREKQNEWRQKAALCNSPEYLTICREMVEKISAAMKLLKNKDSRAEYDEQLDYAIENNLLDTEAQQLAQDIYDELERLFNAGDYTAVIRKCQELLNSNTTDKKVYNYMAQSFYITDHDAEAIRTVDECLKIFPDDMDTLQLAARYYNVCNNDIQKAQGFINHMLELDSDAPLAISEQGYLHLCAGNKDAAFKTYDEYINNHPTDYAFREYAAMSMINYSYTLFTDDGEGNLLLISQEAYDECLALAEKASSIYDNEHIKEHLEYTKQFGQIEFNKDNRSGIIWTMFSGITYAVLGLVYLVMSIVGGSELGGSGVAVAVIVGLVVLAIGVLCIYAGIQLFKVSKRPYWQIFRYELTGYRDKKEKLYVTIGKIFSGWMRLSWKISKGMFKFIFRFFIPGM